ncbi:hypothetical protein SAMN05216349_12851 [Oribacterium sp. KHPX15]|uniref:hypothetical protein n=1 Tax=unclassified Oribacterium TaxID=2629782 RepID=UPI000895621E|nr:MULTISPECIES: hypothetical protein [unclassified Oribacterium]SEA78396.1 hypothetical protein SAMN05216349_12851 [Oribacterium sp. KHPX15]
MRLFIAINFNENMKYALLKMQNELKKSGVKGSFTREDRARKIWDDLYGNRVC